jgi:hypothetical protein
MKGQIFIVESEMKEKTPENCNKRHEVGRKK